MCVVVRLQGGAHSFHPVREHFPQQLDLEGAQALHGVSSSRLRASSTPILEGALNILRRNNCALLGHRWTEHRERKGQN